ncbi:hypothetical protein [Rheinheimera sp. EpRS3]|uniref:hypothetical protein n=1 Tax=Rheinheimera sp. EpRS3 TaxID=1712383 RepID=UPI000ABE3203|nr:hypothetical protein [Rheinheimera sp. EpRS3]
MISRLSIDMTRGQVKVVEALSKHHVMNSRIMQKLKFIAAAITISGLLVFGFFANEARKEVYYLCGNFSKGTVYSSVIRQLNTVNLSEYRVENLPQGKRIIHSSVLHFHLLSCDIEFNQQEKVISVLYG